MEQLNSYEIMEYLRNGQTIYNDTFHYVKRDSNGVYLNIMNEPIEVPILLHDNNIYQYTWYKPSSTDLTQVVEMIAIVNDRLVKLHDFMKKLIF